MKIHDQMNLEELATIMGPGADRGDAWEMRCLMQQLRWTDADTEDIPRDEWLGMLDFVAARTWKRMA